MQKLVIIGHSFVPRFDEFRANDESLDCNLGFENTVVSCIGRRGLTLQTAGSLEGQIRSEGPAEFAIIILGDNDIGKMDTQSVARGIISFSEQVQDWTGGARVIIFSMFPRFWRRDHMYYTPDYNRKAYEVNQYLLQLVDNGRRIFMWESDAFAITNPRAERFFNCEGRSGGVHLNSTGNFWLYKAIRKAVGVIKFQ